MTIDAFTAHGMWNLNLDLAMAFFGSMAQVDQHPIHNTHGVWDDLAS